MYKKSTEKISNVILSILPLLPCIAVLRNITNASLLGELGKCFLISLSSLVMVYMLVPVVSEYTLKKGLSGKDMGKKGMTYENNDIPEALGIVSGVVFLICAIVSQLVFAKDEKQLMVSNSALFSICFMIFLGFTDDTLDLKWRYKLILPTIASLPLLVTYSGSTAFYVPTPFRFLLWSDNKLTYLGSFIDHIATVDVEAHGAIIELGSLFLVFMGLLSVFCTNSINILAGINGLECGQAYIIACSILFFKLYEMSQGDVGENQMFAVLMVMPFIAACLGLLRYNWYPARVFVGDTFCYFSGMTFAVIGIHGHFSKTLLLLFLPQIVNFIYSIPQLFKFIPCPRHRLPRVDPLTKLMSYSAFPCNRDEYRRLKVKPDDTECPNLTIICLVLRILGPMHERTLTITLLVIQALTSVVAFYIRYILLEEKN